ncbi:hypothetical protein [Streptomyces qinzhouensis]|uniref:hypothetical protein n=1 Tax=Streptomyces qinzhouensis TaxID=2599401 RepID=UPI001648F3C9|nr:hypothetical protein [Streptomyces qinzhouensis]
MRAAVAGFARREWGPLYGEVRGALVERRWRAVPLTLVAVVLIAAFQLVQNQEWGYDAVRATGFVRAADPLWLALLRTPLSLFVPALDLPVWGALAQVLLVFGVAEICLGRLRTLLVAYVCTLAGTLYARLGIAVGPGGPLGLPEADARIVDTGPSAAVVGLAVVVCLQQRAWFTGAAVVVAMAVEVVVKPNLAGKEHLAAIAAALVLYAAAAAVRRRWGQSPRGPGGRGGVRDGSRSGAPAIRS